LHGIHKREIEFEIVNGSTEGKTTIVRPLYEAFRKSVKERKNEER